MDKKLDKYLKYGKQALNKVQEIIPPPAVLQELYARQYNRSSDSFRSRTSAEDFQGDDIEDIVNEVRNSGRLYEDPRFPANQSSLGDNNPRGRVEWKRPREIVGEPQFFVDGASRFDVTQGELGDCWLLAAVCNLTLHPVYFNQTVPSNQNFGTHYTGMFYFRFWRFGKWINVAVDDRLPTVDNKLIFLRSNDIREFWSALFEKAFAKLYGSYAALTGGRPSTAMDDFTGGVSEIFDLKSEVRPNFFDIMLKGFERGSLMAASIEPNPGIQEERITNGLIRGHAYSITCVKYCTLGRGSGRTVPLIRLRNPWGNDAEWNGPWSDGSSEWRSVTADEKHLLGLNFNSDGEFWMEFEDFCHNFSSLEMTNVNLESLMEKDVNNYIKHRWEVQTFEGSWVRGVTAGGCSNNSRSFWNNPKYVVTLKEEDDGDSDLKCTMIVALLQKPKKLDFKTGKPKLLSLGFTLFPVNCSAGNGLLQQTELRKLSQAEEIKGLSTYINHRQVSHRFQLPPGSYCIVPSTFNPNEEGTFLLRIFSEKPNIINTSLVFNSCKCGDHFNMDNNNPYYYRKNDCGFGFIEPNASVLSNPVNNNPVATAPLMQNPGDPLRQVFDSLAGQDKEIDWTELQNLLNQRFHSEFTFEGFSKSACRSMVAMLDLDKSGKLGFDEFVHLWNIICMWKNAFLHHDRDRSGFLDGFEFRDALLTSGFQVPDQIFRSLLIIYGDRNTNICFDDFVLCSIRLSKAMKTFTEKDYARTNSATFTMEEFLESVMCV